MLNDGARHFWGVLRTVKNDIQDAVWEASGGKDGANAPEAAWRHFRAFEHAGVAGGEGIGYSTEAKNEGGVPESYQRLWMLGRKERRNRRRVEKTGITMELFQR